jgi:hypothetical protein
LTVRMWYIAMHMAQIKGKYLWKFGGRS